MIIELCELSMVRRCKDAYLSDHGLERLEELGRRLRRIPPVDRHLHCVPGELKGCASILDAVVPAICIRAEWPSDVGCVEPDE